MRYMFAAETSAGDLSEGIEFKSDEWPHHVTVVPWFDADSSDLAIEALERTAERVEQASAIIGETALFGANEDIEVSRLLSADLINIHLAALAALDDLGLKVNNPQFVGQAYKPHITHHDVESLPREGDEITMSSLSLVERIISDGMSLRVVIRQAKLAYAND